MIPERPTMSREPDATDEAAKRLDLFKHMRVMTPDEQARRERATFPAAADVGD